MERKINLEEFWAKRYPNGKLPKYAKEIAIELIKDVLELAAENAKVDRIVIGRINANDGSQWNDFRFIVDKQSILNTINQVE